MVADVLKRTERLDLARKIIRAELLHGEEAKQFTDVEITKAAWVYLKITRHNTDRLKAKLRRLSNA